MDRRHLLRTAGTALAVGFAGCGNRISGRSGDQQPPAGTETTGEDGGGGTRDGRGQGSATETGTPSPTDTPTATRTPPGTRRTARVLDRSQPAEAPVRYALEVVEPRESDRPPVLRTRVENTGRETVRLGEGRRARHYEIRSVDDAVWLRNPGLLAATGEGCWELEQFAARSLAYEVLELGPGERVTARSYVLGTEREPGNCLPTGSHRFRPAVFWTTDDVTPDSEDGHPLDWSFSLRVAEH